MEHIREGAGQPAREIFTAWLDRRSRQSLLGNPWTIYSFEIEPEQALIVYGTVADRAAQEEAAELTCSEPWPAGSVISLIPIKSDADVAETDLSGRHVLLVGRPATNRVAARCATKLPVSFADGSFTVRDETYAHPGSAVIAAGENPMNSRYSVVIYAGLGAEATWKCVQHHDPEGLPQPQVFCCCRTKVSRFRVRRKPKPGSRKPVMGKTARQNRATIAMMRDLAISALIYGQSSIAPFQSARIMVDRDGERRGRGRRKVPLVRRAKFPWDIPQSCQAIMRSPRTWRTRVDGGCRLATLRKRSQLDFEIEFFERILTRDPNYVEVLTNLGDLFTQKGCHRRALLVDLRLVQLAAQECEAMYNLACSYALL